MHRKAINPLQELIWCTSAYLFWHGQAFTYPLGRSKVFLVSKPDNIPGLALIFIFTKQLPAMVINAGLLSLIVCGIASSAGCTNYSDSSQRHTALPVMLNPFTLHSSLVYTHMHVPSHCLLTSSLHPGGETLVA